MEKNNKVILATILVTTLLVAVIGTTYAYFTANVTTSGSAKQVDVKTSVLTSVQMNLGSTITSNNAFPGHKEMKELVVTGTCGEGTCDPANAKIKLSASIDSEFGSDVVYKIYQVSSNFNLTKCINTRHDENNEYYETVSGCALPNDATEITTLTGSTTATKYKDIVVNAGDTFKYILVVEYINNPSANQQTQGKKYSVSMDLVTSEELEKVKLYTLVSDNDSNDEISVGDEINITGTNENFYVFSNDGTTINALAKYNLNAGGEYNGSWTAYENPTYLQDSTMIGYTSAGYPYKGTTKFSDAKNWSNGEDRIETKATGILRNALNIYQTKLPEGIAVRLITKTELEGLGCVGTSCTSAPAWLYSTSYWSGSAHAGDAKLVWDVNSEGGFSYNAFDDVRYCGVRPVISLEA